MWEEDDRGFGLERVDVRPNERPDSWGRWDPSCPVGNHLPWNACRARPVVKVVTEDEVFCLVHAIEYLTAKIEAALSGRWVSTHDWWWDYPASLPHEAEASERRALSTT